MWVHLLLKYEASVAKDSIIAFKFLVEISSSKSSFSSLLTPGGKVTLSATAPTDIWRKPPYLDVFTAPVISKSLPISSFKRVQVSVTGEWSTLYDQGGLIFVLPAKKSGTQKRWIKTGIEFYHNKPCMSVVAADEWADWSLSLLSPEKERAGKMMVEMEREREDGIWGSVLRISLVNEKGDKMPIREVTWAFHDLDEDDEILVGVYAAKPTKDERNELLVNFEGFEIEYRD
jgi:regulation of enolase protein 1 (concanavalin A-like superfamily)